MSSDAYRLPTVVYDEHRAEQLLARLHEEKRRLATLPRNSHYVKHRMKVVCRAIHILSPTDSRTQEEDAFELASLLNSLSL